MKNILKTILFTITGMVLAASSCQKDKDDGVKPLPETENCNQVSKLKSISDGEEYFGSFSYNNQGKVVQLTEYNADSSYFYKSTAVRNSAGLITSYEYSDLQGNSEGRTEYTYNSDNKLIQVKTIYLHAGGTEEDKATLEYNSNGYLEKHTIERTRSNGWQPTESAIFTAHDGAGNPTEAELYYKNSPADPAEFTGTGTITYDSNPNPWKNLEIPHAYEEIDQALRLTTVNNPKTFTLTATDPSMSYSETFSNQYDAKGRLVNQSYANVDGDFTFEFIYPACE